MTARGTAIQGGLAAVGLIAAYLTWQREPETGKGDVLVLDIRRNDLERIRFEDEKTWVELHRQKHGGEPAIWLTVAPREEPKPGAEPGREGAPPAPAVAKIPQRELRGSDQADKLYEKFAPLRASRALGALDAAKLKELGLEGAKKKLTVTARGATHTFAVGSAPGTVADPYLRDERDGRVYVVPRSVVSDLENASVRLVDRRLHAFKMNDVDRLILKAGERKRELVQLRPEDQHAAKLAPAKSADKPDDMAKNWHDKVWRLFPMDILGRGELPTGGEPPVKLRLEYAYRGKTVGWVDLATVGTEAMARSEHTPGWVKLHTTPELIGEGEKIAGTEP